MSEPAPAFYALTGGGWRDWWTLLHPPYTLWHLSYVGLGAATAPIIRTDRLLYSLLAFFLAVGVGAHALDELNGRPLRTAIPARALWAAAALSLVAAAYVGWIGVRHLGPAFWPFIAAGTVAVLAYNLEWFGGAFHTDFWFAFTWGAFPALTASWAQTGRFTGTGALVAAACHFISLAQRALSTPVRAARRRTTRVEGEIERTDGTTEPITRATLVRAPEAALRALSLAMPALATATILARPHT